MFDRHTVALACAALPLVGGCFLDHGRDDPGGGVHIRPAVFSTVCTEGPTSEISELVFYGPPEACHRLRCDAVGWEEPSGGVVELRTVVEDRACGGPATGELGRCALPITRVGRWRLRIDDEAEIHLSIPYDDPTPTLGQCFTPGGGCLSGVAPDAAGWPPPEAASPSTVTAFTHIEHDVLDAPPPAYCHVRATRDGIEAQIRYADEADPGCHGWSREATCHVPPLPEGRYDFAATGRSPTEGTVVVEAE